MLKKIIYTIGERHSQTDKPNRIAKTIEELSLAKCRFNFEQSIIVKQAG